VPQCIPTPGPGATVDPNHIATIAPGTFVGQPNSTAFIGEYLGITRKYLGFRESIETLLAGRFVKALALLLVYDFEAN